MAIEFFGDGGIAKVSRPEVCIISCFDRGQWLAAALAEKDYQVKLVDVSAKMGRWAPEDWEGPFGLFHLESLSQLQNERISEEDYFENVDEGLILWLKEGPLELKGPLTAYGLEKLGLSQAYDILINYQKDGKLEPVLQFINNNKFKKSWIIYLAFFLAANKYDVGQLEMDESIKPISFSSPYSVRRPTRKGLDKSFQWCETKGVQCLREVDIRDVSMNGRICEGVEVSSSWSGVLKSDYFVWMLTGEETLRFDEKVISKLFPQGILRSQWSWVRYRLSIPSQEHYATLPLKFVMIDDIFLPWSHENLCLVQKGVSQGDVDCFVRIPTHHRFQKQYLEQMAEKIRTSFSYRIPVSGVEITNLPQDYYYNEEELGPSRFPVYSPNELKNYSHRKFKNLFFSSPEQWSSQDLSRQLKWQEDVLTKILKIESEKKSPQNQKEVEL
ncbi:MAG: hypothetical protein KDD40_10440 [Bdellovibrionales bacterium]|nr:hypothetical protein [Bdellovibrionales bacterium]